MNFYRLHEDEVYVTDGKTVVLVLARNGKVEIESSSLEAFTEQACEGCEAQGPYAHGHLCEGCTVGQEIPR